MTDTKHNTPWIRGCNYDNDSWIEDGNGVVLATLHSTEHHLAADTAEQIVHEHNNHAPLVEALERELKTCYACNGKPMYQGYADNCEACRESRKVLANAKGATDE